MYFINCNTQEEAKAEYKRLAMIHHPDHGGDLRTMQEINALYATFAAHEAGQDARRRQNEAHTAGRKSAADFHDIREVEGVLRAKIEAALNMGLDVELMGLWVWVTGPTKANKEALKAQGFKWAPKKE